MRWPLSKKKFCSNLIDLSDYPCGFHSYILKIAAIREKAGDQIKEDVRSKTSRRYRGAFRSSTDILDEAARLDKNELNILQKATKCENSPSGLSAAVTFYKHLVSNKTLLEQPYERLHTIYVEHKEYRKALNVCRAYIQTKLDFYELQETIGETPQDPQLEPKFMQYQQQIETYQEYARNGH